MINIITAILSIINHKQA